MKGLVISIIVLFVGAGIVPSTGIVNKSINLIGENSTVIDSKSGIMIMPYLQKY